MSQTSQRRHDIDWLRVILFGLLVPFHVAIGVYWSTYGLEINPNIDDLTEKDRLEFVEENNDYSADSVTPESMFLHWMHQWRLAALFMISGMGTAFAFRRRGLEGLSEGKGQSAVDSNVLWCMDDGFRWAGHIWRY